MFVFMFRVDKMIKFKCNEDIISDKAKAGWAREMRLGKTDLRRLAIP